MGELRGGEIEVRRAARSHAMRSRRVSTAADFMAAMVPNDCNSLSRWMECDRRRERQPLHLAHFGRQGRLLRPRHLPPVARGHEPLKSEALSSQPVVDALGGQLKGPVIRLVGHKDVLHVLSAGETERHLCKKRSGQLRRPLAATAEELLLQLSACSLQRSTVGLPLGATWEVPLAGVAERHEPVAT
eukprot:scaffold60459_cov31-Tisochrysis_lutea.AAC.4